MGKRKLFLLFLSAMTVSIIIMVIVYGLFLKDVNFTFNIKNPESAPSPIDAFTNEETAKAQAESDDGQGPAKVVVPDNGAKADASNTTADANADTSLQNDKPLTNVVPLEPQINNNPDELAPLPDTSLPDNLDGPDTTPSPSSNTDAAPTLHYVYLDGFSTKEAAQAAVQQLQDRKLAAQPQIRQHKGQVVLQFGVFSDRENAEVMAQQLRNQNIYVKID